MRLIIKYKETGNRLRRTIFTMDSRLRGNDSMGGNDEGAGMTIKAPSDLPVYKTLLICYHCSGSGCCLVAVPAFKAVRGAIALSPVGSIPTPSAITHGSVAYFPLSLTSSVTSWKIYGRVQVE